LAAVGIVGTAVELAIDRHWDSTLQLVPWFALAVATVALVLVRGHAGRRRLAVGLAAAVAVTAFFGVFEHVKANVDAGFLDAAYGATWGSRTTLSRWWIAASGGVGPSPVLAPGILLQAALCIVFAGVFAESQPPRVRSTATSEVTIAG
jgi:hypothetical protein